MFKKYFAPVLVCWMTLSPLYGAGKDDDLSKKLLTYSSLAVKEERNVHSYHAFFIQVTFVNPKPAYEISFINVTGRKDGNPGTTTIKPLLSIVPKIDPVDLANIKSALTDLPNRKPFKAVPSDSDENRGSLLKFNVMDKNNNLALSEWVDRESGFTVKSESFGPDGRILFMEYYAFLKINPGEGDSFPPDAKHEIMSLEKASELSDKTVSFLTGDDFNPFMERFLAERFHGLEDLH